MTITDEKVLFSILWIALMLIYLLGDVLRIFAGDFVAGEIGGEPVASSMWMAAAVMMVIPIIMIVLNILLPGSAMIWPNIIVSVGFLLMNLVGIMGYKPYDQFLLVISFGVNIIVIYYAFFVFR